MGLDVAIVIVLALLAYAWLGYPWLMRRIVPPRPFPPAQTPQRIPRLSVDVLLSAHNEEQHIGPRLRNLLQSEAAKQISTVRVGLDGCTDATAERVRACAEQWPHLRMTESPERRGKSAMLKQLAAQSRADILVLTDANTLFAPDTISRLVMHFSDPGTGGVCGRLVFTKTGKPEVTNGQNGSAEGLYWGWETDLKVRESAVDSCLGANGAVYAIRRELFWGELPDNTVVDDFVLGMKVREQGFRMVYDPEAGAYEEFPEPGDEWRRRVRIGAGDFQALHLCRRCLLPRYGAFAWMFFSHKVLRWFTPHLALLAVVCSLARWWTRPAAALPGSAWPAVAVLAGAGIGLAGAACGGRCATRGRAGRLFGACRHFVAMQAALFVGSCRCLAGDLKGHWTRTPRSTGISS